MAKKIKEVKELKNVNLTDDDIHMLVTLYNGSNIGPVVGINEYNFIMYKEAVRIFKNFIKSKKANPVYKEQATKILEKLV